MLRFAEELQTGHWVLNPVDLTAFCGLVVIVENALANKGTTNELSDHTSIDNFYFP